MEYPSMELVNRGSIVSCQTCFNQTIEGGVMAFDPTTKMLILKCAPDSGQTKLNDVYVVNLDLCSKVEIKQEVNTIPNAPPLLNLQRIATRKRNAVDEKRRLVQALNAGVTPEGQKLFMAISKTIGQQVTWEGSDILVFGDTLIMPPYRPENVRGNDERRLIYVKKLVESQWKDATPSSTAAAANSQAVPGVTTGGGGGGAANPPMSNNSNNNMAASNGTTSNTSSSSSSSSAAGVTAGAATPATTTTSATNNNNSNSSNTPSTTSGASAN